MGDTPDTIAKLYISLPNHWWHSGESIWAQDLGGNQYKIDNIPFCAYGLNLGDIVHAVSAAPDLKPEIQSVIRRSGNRTLRLSFSGKLTRDEQTLVLASLEQAGAELERANAKFVCINVPPLVSLSAIRSLLDDHEQEGNLEYETCEERVPGSFDDRSKQGNS